MYNRIAALLPRKVRDSFKKEFDYLGINIDSGRFVGFLFSFAFLVSIAIALNFYYFFNIELAYTFIIAFIIFTAGIYLWLSITSEAKGKFVEKILPDALQLIASNIRSGLTTERAFLVSARPEFGPLELELKRASKRILTGTRIQDALEGISRRIRSPILEQTVWLVNKGISSGGQIADVLTQLSDDLRDQNALKDETKANISVYVMLIFFSAAIGAPLMLGISSFIVQILNKQTSNINIPSNAAMASMGSRTPFFGIPQAKISPEFVLLFSEAALLVSIFFASMVMGIINSGSEKNGFKYFPILLIVGFALFFAIRFTLLTMFKQLV